VKDKSEAEIGNARKRKYFCVTCVGGKHPVSLKTRRTFDHIDKKTRKFTALACFLHHGGGNRKNSKLYNNKVCSETATHWQAKHILCEHVGAYRFETSKCSGCAKHTNIEDGTGAVGRVEYTEKILEGKTYRFDAVLMCNKAVNSVLEDWATHETSEQKREYCLEQGYTFAEFHALHVVEAHKKAAPGVVFMLENLKTRVFECQGCAQARQKLEQLRIIQAAEQNRLKSLEVERQKKLYTQELENQIALLIEARHNEIELQETKTEERLLAIESEKLRVAQAAEKRCLAILEVDKQKKLQAQKLENQRALEMEARDNELKLRIIRLEEERKALELEKMRQEEMYTEYYNKTSAGQETHILQLQDTLHCNYLYTV